MWEGDNFETRSVILGYDNLFAAGYHSNQFGEARLSFL